MHLKTLVMVVLVLLLAIGMVGCSDKKTDSAGSHSHTEIVDVH